VFRQRPEYGDAETDGLVGDGSFGYGTFVIWRVDLRILPKAVCRVAR